MDFIKGEQFPKIADMVYAPNANYDCNKLGNTFCLRSLEDGDVVYCHTMYVKQLFEELKKTDKKIILISHNCDTNVDYSFEIPENIIHWFSQNVDLEHPALESIPIGLENSKWFPELDKPGKILSKSKEKKDIKNLCYINHNISTNVKERIKPYQLLDGMDWMTIHKGHNGYCFDRYINEIYSHKFMICPDGNGIDTHRVWECLYLGTIPIQKRGINNQFYIDLPICFIDDWDEVTKYFLNSEYERITHTVWNMDKLNFNYWKTKILSYA